MATLGRAALAAVDLVLPQDVDIDYRLRYSVGNPPVAVNLTSWSAHAQIRGGDDSLWLDLTSPTGLKLGIDGTVAIQIPHTATAASEWQNRRHGFWDLELTSPTGTRIRLAAGQVTVSREVTRDV